MVDLERRLGYGDTLPYGRFTTDAAGCSRLCTRALKLTTTTRGFAENTDGGSKMLFFAMILHVEMAMMAATAVGVSA